MFRPSLVTIIMLYEKTCRKRPCIQHDTALQHAVCRTALTWSNTNTIKLHMHWDTQETRYSIPFKSEDNSSTVHSETVTCNNFLVTQLEKKFRSCGYGHELLIILGQLNLFFTNTNDLLINISFVFRFGQIMQWKFYNFCGYGHELSIILGQLNLFSAITTRLAINVAFVFLYGHTVRWKARTFLRHYQRSIMITWFKGYLSSTWTQILVFCPSCRISMPFTASE